jgi:glycosyltransferase involved in cell wall biosynthesis
MSRAPARLRILWVSDSPTSPTGYGMVTAAVCRRLAARGHQVEILGWQNAGRTRLWEGIPVLPVRLDLSGRDVLPGYLDRFRPDFLITLSGIGPMSFLAEPPGQQLLDRLGTRWVLYYPIGAADPAGRLPAGTVRLLRTVNVPVAMSRFGLDVFAACGIAAAYVPHGSDLDLFAPPANKQAAKARLGYAGAFVVLSDARNQPRKLWPRTLDIVEAFARDKPDVIAHLHCDPDDLAASSPLYTYRLRADVAALGLADRVRFTEDFRIRSGTGLPPESLARLYAAADVHLLSSWGEGFGLPTLQAASAGVVPVAVDYSANTELLGEHGVAVPAESALLDDRGMVCCLLSRGDAVAALERLYADRALLAERSRGARQFALDYGWERVVDRWEEVLEAAPPRRRPGPTGALSGRAGAAPQPEAAPPEAAAATLAERPAGPMVQMRSSERRAGLAGARIPREPYAPGDTLTIPVRLPPAFPGAPRAGIGRVLVGPGDLAVAAQLLAIFPALTVSVPMTSGDVALASFLPLEQLVPRLARCVLVVNDAGGVPAPLDLACAVLGVPYAGPSPLWPEIAASSSLGAARALLTDQGLSAWRRRVAAERAAALAGPRAVEEIRALAPVGRPEPPALLVDEYQLTGLKEPVRDRVGQMLGLLAGDSRCEPVLERRAQELLCRRFDAEAEEVLAIVLEGRAQRLLDQGAPVGAGYVAPLEELRAIGPDTRVHRPTYMTSRVSTTGGRASIEFLGVTVTGPGRIEPALRFVAAARSFLVRELPGRLGDGGKLVLVRRLVSAGLLTIEAA